MIELSDADVRHAFEGGCPQCKGAGDSWVNLRICMVCGQVGCCDDSPNTHATKHWQATGHPVVRSLQPGEDWQWNYATGDYEQ